MKKLILISTLLFFLGCSERAPIPEIYTHCLFNTPVTIAIAQYPSIQIDVLDESEWWGTAELYLTVQTSRFPANTFVVLPVNRGQFDGVTKQFVRLPFEVREGDSIAFNLLDNDTLTYEQEMLLVGGCRATGYCIVRAGAAYQPVISMIAKPGVDAAMHSLATLIIAESKLHQFENMGDAEYTVPEKMPTTPSQANLLTLLDDSRYSRVQLKIYEQSK